MRYTHPDYDVVINAPELLKRGDTFLRERGWTPVCELASLVLSNREGNDMAENKEKGLRSHKVVGADGFVALQIKGTYLFKYRKAEDGKYEGTLNIGDESGGDVLVAIKGKTEKSVISNAYHRVQKLVTTGANGAKATKDAQTTGEAV